jgi:hypothetical protein
MTRYFASDVMLIALARGAPPCGAVLVKGQAGRCSAFYEKRDFSPNTTTKIWPEP